MHFAPVIMRAIVDASRALTSRLVGTFVSIPTLNPVTAAITPAIASYFFPVCVRFSFLLSLSLFLFFFLLFFVRSIVKQTPGDNRTKTRAVS